MKKITIWLTTMVLSGVLMLGCAQRQQQQDKSIPPDLLATIDAFYAAIENADTETRIALFAEDAIMMPNHWTMSRGKDKIAEMMRSSAEWVFKLRDRKVVDIDVSGDIAYTVNSYYYTWHAEGAEPQWHKTKNVHIWKYVTEKDIEGSWKLHVDIWNSDVFLSQFPNE